MSDLPRIDTLFNDALERPLEKRADFVRVACAGDEDLCNQVLRLLERHEKLNSFLVPPSGSRLLSEEPAKESIKTTRQLQTLTLGSILGNRYRIEEVLGSGGMGDVFLATDLKLRVDVALKAIRPGIFASETGKELLRREVRAAREVVSSNVCRIFDLIVEGDVELVSMEYIDGRTLRDVLKEKGPLQLREAGEIAAQLLGGLEAIHDAGLVHRDLKPENVMITRAGRVVVMDFGLAKEATSGQGTVAGTPGYMAPEQSRGDVVDARADIFSVGVLLTEMVGCQSSDLDSRKELWRGLRENPPQLPDVPWEPVLRRAVAWLPDERFRSVRSLARALEEVNLRAGGDEQVTPYPGLSSFTQKEAEYFFGREAEVEALAKKLQRSSMLAVVGPSGIGKSSFLRAGLVPALPEEWGCLISTPSQSPFTALAHVLAPEVSSDVAAVQQLLHLEDPDVAVDVSRKWREKYEDCLLIVDQFEELFTLNPDTVQSSFTALLSRLVLEADVRVLISMRDDFLFQAHEHSSLKPIFSELTLLDSLSGPSLRRALVQPALACGYRFEDEELVDQMVKEVSDERGALPMLAFAAAHLWERREKVTGTITRKAYREIGGVGGALAQHAEAVLERLGEERIPLVRELFRNLITSQGTRAVVEVGELLSVFESRADAELILRELIDARLLTTYDLPGMEEGNGASRRVEIVHESLLTAWPRIVRWQAQDADGAMLRDQLRQAARLWDERKRSDDLLWTGTAFREFELWREHYPGGLTHGEEAFAAAMERRMQRQKTVRRWALLTTISFLVVVVGVVGKLWRDADYEARRAEARRVLSLAEATLDENVGLSFSYTLAALERADLPEARRLALRTLQSSPIPWQVPSALGDDTPLGLLDFSPDGEWLAIGKYDGGIELWRRSGDARVLERSEGRLDMGVPRFGPGGNVLATFRARASEQAEDVCVWSVPDFRKLLTIPILEKRAVIPVGDGSELLVGLVEREGEARWERWSVADGHRRVLGSLPMPDLGLRAEWHWIDSTGGQLLQIDGSQLHLHDVDELDSDRPIWSVSQEQEIKSAVLHPTQPLVAAGDAFGKVSVWSIASSTPELIRELQTVPENLIAQLSFDDSGDRIAASVGGAGGDGRIWMWDLKAAPAAGSQNLFLLGEGDSGILNVEFLADGEWVGAGTSGGARLWPLAKRRPLVLTEPSDALYGISIDPGRRWLIASKFAGGLVRWNLDPTTSAPARATLDLGSRNNWTLETDPGGEFSVVGATNGVHLVDIETFTSRKLEGFEDFVFAVGVSPDGNYVAAGGGQTVRSESLVRVWDSETTDVVDVYRPKVEEALVTVVAFLSAQEIVIGLQEKGSGAGQVVLWNFDDDTERVLWERDIIRIAVRADHEQIACAEFPVGDVLIGPLSIIDLPSGTVRQLREFGSKISSIQYTPDGRIVTGSSDGTIRVGYPGDEPHLLLGHTGEYVQVDVTPDGKWIASSSFDKTARIWPMPDAKKPPLHTLPYDELMETLRGITNLRMVQDESQPSGFRKVVEPFPGWESVPDW